MKRLLRALATLAALVVTCLPALALADDLFARAGKDYAARNYDAAIAEYEKLVESGVTHQDLYYDLGNAYYRSAQSGHPERIGHAILYYERALRMEPSFDDARYNLEVARDSVAARYGQDKVQDAAKEPTWIQVATSLPLSKLAWIFLSLDVLFFGLLIILRFLPTGFLRTGLVVGDVLCGVAFLGFGALLAAHVYFLETVQLGVVVADEVTMREGPDATRREGPKLHAGPQAELLRTDSGWVRLRLANNMEGWVPKEAVEPI